jgi:hypothetical protein
VTVDGPWESKVRQAASHRTIGNAHDLVVEVIPAANNIPRGGQDQPASAILKRMNRRQTDFNAHCFLTRHGSSL